MAVTITKSPRGSDSIGRRRHIVVTLTLDNSYPTGGYAITAGQFGASNGRVIEGAALLGGNAAAGGYQPIWDNVNGKLMVWRTGAVNAVAEQVPNATDLSALVYRFVFYLV